MKKLCLTCSGEYTKNPKLSYKQFESKKFCSLACAHKSFTRTISIICSFCLKDFLVPSKKYRKFCSSKCCSKYRTDKRSFEIKQCKNCELGFKIWTSKMASRPGKYCSNKCHSIARSKIKGERHFNWKKDRNTLCKKQERNDSAYQNWRKQVWLRDNFKCKIANPDCSGKVIVHHILGWASYPELRYQINNGITLCHAHHPRKRAEEKRLVPVFQELVPVSKV